MEVDGEDGEDEELPGKIRNDPAIRKKKYLLLAHTRQTNSAFHAC